MASNVNEGRRGLRDRCKKGCLAEPRDHRSNYQHGHGRTTVAQKRSKLVKVRSAVQRIWPSLPHGTPRGDRTRPESPHGRAGAGLDRATPKHTRHSLLRLLTASSPALEYLAHRRVPTPVRS